MPGDNTKSLSGLYVHIPFCRSKCDYCSFYSIREDSSPYVVDAYITRLIEELESFRKNFGTVSFDTLYAGGGTPSILSVSSMSRLLDSARSLFSIAEGAEITVEMNPDDLSRDKLYGFRDAGATRIQIICSFFCFTGNPKTMGGWPWLIKGAKGRDLAAGVKE